MRLKLQEYKDQNKKIKKLTWMHKEKHSNMTLKPGEQKLLYFL